MSLINIDHAWAVPHVLTRTPRRATPFLTLVAVGRAEIQTPAWVAPLLPPSPDTALPQARDASGFSSARGLRAFGGGLLVAGTAGTWPACSGSGLSEAPGDQLSPASWPGDVQSPARWHLPAMRP